MRATLELALVDAAGQRSEPVRVALTVGLPVAPGTGPGEVLAVRQVGNASANDWATTIGTAAGAVVGFLTGRQVGKGGGRTAATVIGTAGGAWAGYEVGKRVGGDPNAVYETTVRLDDGSTRVITTRGTPPWAPGARVVWDGRTVAPGTPR
jgi:outer membrane lipoprotein SlyB